MIAPKKSYIFILLAMSVGVSYGMLQLPSLHNATEMQKSYREVIYDMESRSDANPLSGIPCHAQILTRVVPLPEESRMFHRKCVANRVAAKIYSDLKDLSSDSYFYYAPRSLHTCYQLWGMTSKGAMQRLNSIEQDLMPVLQRNGYTSWNDELIEELRIYNIYFSHLIRRVFEAQTRWQDLKASNVDDFFRWDGKPLKKSKIGMYIHLKVMKKYAEEFNIQKYTPVKLMNHMLNRVMFNVKDDINELHLLLKTNFFHSMKDNKAIHESCLKRIGELAKKASEEL